MEGTIGEIRFFAGSYAPQTWALCVGQLLSISANTAVFSILGTTYGGDGRTTFGLPDFRGRMPIGVGQRAGLSGYVLGEVAGQENFTVSAATMPSHAHGISGTVTISGNAADGDADTPQGNYPASLTGTDMYSTTSNGSFMADMQHNLGTGATGAPVPVAVNNIQPVLGLNFMICLQGTFPVRD